MKKLLAPADIQRMKRDYANIADRITAEALLDHYGADNRWINGEWVQHSCLIDRVDQHHENADANPSAAMHLDTLGYSCFGYTDENNRSGGDVWWFLLKMEGTPAKVVALLESLIDPDQEVSESRSLKSKIKDNLSRHQEQPEETIPTFADATVKRFQEYHPVFRDRGVSESVANRYLLGFDHQQNRLVLPHLWNGSVVGWQKRVQDDQRYELTTVETDKKYKNSVNFPSKETLWNLDAVKDRGHKTITVVEGVFTVLRAETWYEETGDENFGNYVSCFSDKITDKQIAHLGTFDTVRLFLDMDYQGVSASFAAYEKLRYTHKVEWMILPNRKDMDEIPTYSEAVREIKVLSGVVGYSAARKVIEQWKSTQRRKSLQQN